MRGFWTGASASVMRASLMSGSQLATYDTWKETVVRVWSVKNPPSLHIVGSFISIQEAWNLLNACVLPMKHGNPFFVVAFRSHLELWLSALPLLAF